MKHIRKSVSRGREPCGLYPLAARLVIIGEILMLAAVFDFAARLNIAHLAGSQGALLRLSDFGGSMSASAVILWGFALFFDYLERVQK